MLRHMASAAVLFLFAVALSTASAADYHVDGGADAAGDGSRSAPFRTIQEAADVMEAGDVCYIHAGTYRESVSPTHSGSPDSPMVFRPFRDEKVVVSGTEPVTGWTATPDDGIYSADVSLELGHRNQVFADGDMMFKARWPDAGGTDPDYLLEFQMATMDEGTQPTKIVDSALPDVDWSGSTVWVSSHKRWFSWTGGVKEAGDGFLRVENNADRKGNQVCKQGGKYYVFGAKSLLDAPNEWYYDGSSETLCVWMPDGGRPASRVEVRKRRTAFDLRGTSNVVLKDLNIFGATLTSDQESRNIVLDGLRARYIHHSVRAENQYGSQGDTGIRLEGKGHVVRNCEIAYSSGNCLTLSGSDLRVVNNYIHDADYIGSYAAPVRFGGDCSDCVVSHNTIRRAGRTTVNVAGFYNSLLQYNDISHAGYLTDDLGLTYGNGVEGGNSEVRYNWLHDNVADSHNMGLYFDHGCKNVIFHHNVIWNVGFAGMINNQYGNYLLYYNNTVSDAQNSYRSTWAAAQEKSLYGCRMVNNVGTADAVVEASGLEMAGNSWNYGELRDSKFLAPGTGPVDGGRPIPGITGEYEGSGPDRGAYELGGVQWRTGHDFQNPPADIDTARSHPPHRNILRNAAFHGGTLAPWKPVGDHVDVISDFHSQWVTDGKAMMGGYSARLGKGQNGLCQVVTGLEPGETYELMAKFRVPAGETARLRVKDHGEEARAGEAVSGNAPEWMMKTLRFTTGPGRDSATVLLQKSSSGGGDVYVDDPGLRLVPDD